MNPYNIEAPDKWFQNEIEKEGIFDKSSYLVMMSHVQNFGTVVDVGTHCGSWAVPLSGSFKKVICFEPDLENFKFLEKNKTENMELFNLALGAKQGFCGMKKGERNSGQSFISGPGSIEMTTLDSFCFNPDLIKIDVEGFEYFVLQGSIETIKRSKPTVFLEDNGLSNRYGTKFKTIDAFMSDLNYSLKERVNYDCVYTYDIDCDF